MRLSSINITFFNIVLVISILLFPVHSQITSDNLYSEKIIKQAGKISKIELNYFFVDLGSNAGISSGMIFKVFDRNYIFIDRLEVKEVIGDNVCVAILSEKDKRLRKRENRKDLEAGYIVVLEAEKFDYAANENKEIQLKRLNDEDPQVRVNAMDILAKTGGLDILPEIIEVLNEKWDSKAEAKSVAEQNSIKNLKRSATWALGEVAFRGFSQIFLESKKEIALDKEKEEILDKVTHNLINLCSDPDKNVRLDAARNVSRLIAIRQIFGLKSDFLMTPLIKLLMEEDDDYAKRAIIDALAELKDERVIKALVAAWDNKDTSVKMDVNWALEKIGLPVIPYMREILNSADQGKKVNAKQVLYKLGYKVKIIKGKYEIIK